MSGSGWDTAGRISIDRIIIFGCRFGYADGVIVGILCERVRGIVELLIGGSCDDVVRDGRVYWPFVGNYSGIEYQRNFSTR